VYRHRNYLLQLNDVDAGALADRAFELAIIESGYPGHRTDPLAPLPGNSQIPEALKDRPVVAYLNVSVTDYNRTYWNAAANWVVPFSIPGLPVDADDLDGGVLNPDLTQAQIPAWLWNNRGLALGPETDLNASDGDTVADGVFGYIVDFSDADWQARVIAEAEYLVTRGYSGVFLDDVARYESTWFLDQGVLDQFGLPRIDRDTLADYASEMINFVIAVSDAITTINPDAYLVVNGGVDIVDHANLAGSDLAQRYYQAVDGILMESQYLNEISANPDNHAWTRASNLFGPSGTDLLALESLSDPATVSAFFDWAPQNGIVALNAVGDYSALPDSPPDDQPFVITGTAGNDTIYGTSGDDLIYALGGDDLVFGGGGNDTIIGGAGSDTLYGEAGADVIAGGSGGDLLNGGAGPDTLFGGDLPGTYLL